MNDFTVDFINASKGSLWKDKLYLIFDKIKTN